MTAGPVAPAHADPAAPPTAELKFADLAASKAEYDRAVAPFFAQHCAACHGPAKARGDLRLDQLELDMKASTSAARWALLADKIAKGDMPPEGEPRPSAAGVQAVQTWIKAEMKRAGKHFARREAYANGNGVPHEVLFGPAAPAPFDAAPRLRRVSPEIYSATAGDLAKGASGVGQPFSPAGKSTFKDMGDPKIDEPVTAQLIGNALAIVERQTAFKIEDDQIKAVGFTPREYLALLDPKTPPTDAQIAAAVDKQFDTVLKRKPTPDERQRFTAFMRKTMTDAGQVAGARYALAAVFLLPEAVFRSEVGVGSAPDAAGRVRLTPREIAFAVGYALTDKGPDQALLAAADKGELDSPDAVAKHVRRMLDDNKLPKPRILRFFREYFGYDQANDVFKDARAINFHEPKTLIDDTDKLVEYVLEQDKNVLYELLTTNKSFVAHKSAAKHKKERAESLAKFEKEKAANPEKFKNKKPTLPGRSVYEAYSLADFPDQQPVDLPADQRAGILTQPAWLVAWSKSDDNDAIHRGKWVRERLLGGVVPDIPITVDAQLPDEPDQTLRHRMRVTQQEYCYKCHVLMNNVGLPFEAFDHVGRFRTEIPVLDKDATAKNVDKKGKPLGLVTRTVPVDAAGLLEHVGDPALDGQRVAGAVEMIKLLAKSERVEQVFVRHAFRYWTGRNETPGDAASLRAAHKAYKNSGGSMKALITALLTSESFLHRVPVPAAARP